MGKHEARRKRSKWWPVIGVMAAGGTAAGAWSMADTGSHATVEAPAPSDTLTNLPKVSDSPSHWVPSPAAPKPPAKPRPRPSRTRRLVHRVKAAARPRKHARPPAVRPGSVSALVAFLKAQVGKPYVWGGTGPNAYDCSGLVQTAMARIGVHLPRTSEEQSTVGTRIGLGSLRPGDLLFWGPPGEASHTAIYIGGGRYVAAENPRVGVVEYSLSYYAPDYGRRVL